MKILKDFIHGFNFVAMMPTNLVTGLAEGLSARTLAEPGRGYAIYICENAKKPEAQTRTTPVELNVPAGRYRVEWVNTRTGKAENRERRDHKGDVFRLNSPEFSEDVALRVTR